MFVLNAMRPCNLSLSVGLNAKIAKERAVVATHAAVGGYATNRPFSLPRDRAICALAHLHIRG